MIGREREGKGGEGGGKGEEGKVEGHDSTHIQEPTILARAGQVSSRSAPTAALSSTAPLMLLLLP